MATTAPAGVATISADELRAVLADLARAHQQKVMLATWVGAPFIGPPTHAAIKPFYLDMGKQHGALLAELREWAKGRGIDLTYRYTPDTPGRAYKIMEDRQEKMVRGDKLEDFDRDMLMQMYTDYEWQISTLQALLPQVKDPGLRAYVEKSLRVHEAGSGAIVNLLKRFRFAE
jgi:hypothetical protein